MVNDPVLYNSARPKMAATSPPAGAYPLGAAPVEDAAAEPLLAAAKPVCTPPPFFEEVVVVSGATVVPAAAVVPAFDFPVEEDDGFLSFYQS